MFFFKRNYIYLIFLFFLLIILAYVANITSIPDSVILFQNQEFNIKTIAGVKLEESIPVGTNISTANSSFKKEDTFLVKKDIQSQKEYNLSLLGFNLKTIRANVIANTKVIPLGSLVGLKLYTKGVLVVGLSEIKGADNKIYKPYEEAGIKQGDSIIEVNNEEVSTTEELIECVSKSKGKEIELECLRDGNIFETKLLPVKTSNNSYKIGIWVRDASAGVGTATFYDKETNSIASLGHGIQDVDTGNLVDISTGEFVTSEIIDIQKGEKDNPGKIEGTIEDSKLIGKIYTNTDFGVYGTISNKDEIDINNIEEVEVASRNEIGIGKASIICTLEDGIRKEYEVEVQKVYMNNNENNKSMVVKVIDKELLEKTGGIIQGMSGSPILQNGKLIGALTHVLVSDPTKGYGVFADIMVNNLRSTQ